jgi:periplasmic protein TonB
MHMPRDLFGTVTNPPARIGSRSRLTLPLSLAAHAVALAALIVVPLVATDVLPLPSNLLTVTLIHPDIPTVPPEAPRQVKASTEPPANPNVAPLVAPDGVSAEKPAPPPTDVGSETVGIVSGPVMGDASVIAAPSPPPPVVERAPVRVGGTVRTPVKVFDVSPVYPPIAIAARKEGIVIIQATLDLRGNVVDAEVLRSEPLLDQAALDAVRQWRYTPTSLNGEPVAVIMTVTVSFRLR